MPLFHSLIAASELNAMIAKHIDALALSQYVHHSNVYLIEPEAGGCNWNVTVNTKDELRPNVGAVISDFLDALRAEYVVNNEDPEVDPALDSDRGRRQLGRSATGRHRAQGSAGGSTYCS